MGSYEILPIGTKLKNLREKYNVKQDEVSGKDVTRNLISQIEHGKANLTKHAAEIVLKNLKTICDIRHIKIDETIEYLMEDEKTQASKILDTCIKELKDLMVYKDTSFVDKLTEVEEFLVKWNITDKKIVIFELAGDYFAGINDYYRSSLYYEKAKTLMDIHSNKNSLSILRKLSMVYFYMGKYEEDVNCCRFALDWFNNDLTEEYRCIFLFNSALCYTELKEYDKAIKNLTELEPIIKNVDSNKYYDILLQKAICFECLEKYEKSLEINNKLLELLNNNITEEYILVLINISEIYQKMNNTNKVTELLDTVKKDIIKIPKNSKHLSTVYFNMGKQYKWLEDFKDAEKYFLQSLKLAKKYTHQFLIGNIILELIDIYFENNDLQKISEIKNEFFILSAKENKIDSKILVKLIYCYAKVGDLQSIDDIYNYSHKFD